MMNGYARARGRGRFGSVVHWSVLAGLVGASVTAGSSAARAASSPTFTSAFQANVGTLWLRGSDASLDNTAQPMAAGTSPAITILAGGQDEVAFQGSNGFLYLDGPTTGLVNTSEGMKAGTSPAIAALPNGGFTVAFQANTGMLWLRGSDGSLDNTAQPMDPKSSPAITTLASGQDQVAFHHSSGFLYLDGPASGLVNTSEGMKAGTSPSVAALPNGGSTVAFQANTGVLWLRGSDGSLDNTAQPMDPASSPAITVLTSGQDQVAFHHSSGFMYLDGPATGLVNTSEGMMAGTSPAITALTDGSSEAAFQANTGFMYFRNSGGSLTNTSEGMSATTSPAIAAPATSSLRSRIVNLATTQIGYEDSPVGTFCNKYTAFWGVAQGCEEWCADFVAWDWNQEGVVFTYGSGAGEINGSAATFAEWAKAKGTWHAAGSGYTPQPGDAVVYGLDSSGTWAAHVALVSGNTAGDSGPNVINGDSGWASTGNGGVDAVNDQASITSSSGTTYYVSGYASPM